MALDPRWKLPQGKTPEQLYDGIAQLIRELRKGDYLPAAVTSLNADAIVYDNATSGLTATDAQAAIDEVEGRVDTLEAAPGVGFFQSAQQTITSGGSLTIAHGLSATPNLVAAVLQCTTAQAGYAIGDELAVAALGGGVITPGISAVSNGVVVVPDATNLNVRYATSANTFTVLNFGTGAVAALTNANWRLVLRAWRF